MKIHSKQLEKNKHIKHAKHREYEIANQFENYSLVADRITGEEHPCFLMRDKYIGDKVFLYEKSVNYYNGRISFVYSVLNHYQKGESYEFDILEVGDRFVKISDSQGLTFGIPLSFLSSQDDTTIKLLVSDFDLDNNRLIFKNENAKLNSSIAECNFEVDKIYELPVIKDYFNQNQTRYAVLEYEGKTITTNLPSALNEVELDETIPFYLGSYKDGTPTLNVVRNYSMQKLYNIGERYKFIIHKKNYDPENGTSYWELKDNYGFYNRYYPNSDRTFDSKFNFLEEGDDIELIVKYHTPTGYLSLVNEITDYSEAKYLAEDLFEAIGYKDGEDKYFFTEDVLNKEGDTSSGKKHTYIDQYNEGENLWIFSYLSFLDGEIFRKLEEGEFDTAKVLVDIYLKIEKWMLEESDYLLNFSPESQFDIASKAENKIQQYSSTLEAINLFLEDKDQEYVEEILKRFKKSPYINPEKRAVFKQLVRISQYFSGISEDKQIYEAIMLLLNHNIIDENDYFSYIQAVEAKIRRISEQVLDVSEDERDDEDLELLIRNQYLLTIFNFKLKDEQRKTVSSAQLLRFLTLYHREGAYLDLAIKLLTQRGYLNTDLFTGLDIFKITVKELNRSIIYPELNLSYYEEAGIIRSSSSGLDITPGNLNFGDLSWNSYNFLSFPELNIRVTTDIELNSVSEETSSENLLAIILEAIQFKKESIDIEKEEIDFDRVYIGRVKPKSINKAYCFVEFEINNQIKETLFHISQFRAKSSHRELNSFILDNDLIKFKIKDYEDGKFSIVPLETIFERADFLEEEEIGVLAKVENRIGGQNLCITDKGFPVSFYDITAEIGDVFEIEIGDFLEEYGNFSVTRFEKSDLTFEEDTNLLWREYLIKTEFIIGQNEINKKLLGERDKFLKSNAGFLINCLEQRVNYLEDEKEIILNYFLLIVLSSIIRNNKSYTYLPKLENLQKAILFKNNHKLEDLLNSISGDIEWSNFEGDRVAFELIEFLETDIIDIPVKVEDDSDDLRLKKLIETYNLFLTFEKNEDLLAYFKELIANVFYGIIVNQEINHSSEFQSILIESDSTEKSEEEITNLGSESRFKEFKSSFFYSASDESQDQVILRTIAGFLNAYDGIGKLFIGVNDLGDIIGLENDLNHSPQIKNLDQYQNHIQSRVASAFPKEVNAMLDYHFHRAKNHTYLEIIIPSHDTPIAYNGEFYQRQGVQTRILKGTDVTDFIARKLSLSPRERKVREYTYDNTINEDLVKNIADPGIDYYSDFRQSGETMDVEHGKRADFLSYLYIFEDNTYMVSANEVDDFSFKIPIHNSQRRDYLLMCYDNACINKVEIRSLLSKTLNKRYSNAMSSMGKLIAVYVSNDSAEVAVKTKRFESKYVKIYKVESISAHRILGLKGNCIVQDDFDKVLYVQSFNNLPVEFDTFRRDSRQGLGAKINPKNQELLDRLKTNI